MTKVRMELHKVNTVVCDGHTVTGHGGNSGIPYMARHLISLGYDPLAEFVCYRGDTLCISGGTLEAWSKINYVETDDKSTKRKKYIPFKWSTKDVLS